MYELSIVKNAILLEKSAKYGYIRDFLIESGLTPDTDADVTVCLSDENTGALSATASLYKNIIKYIAVSESEQGTGAAAQAVSELLNYAYNAKIKKLFLFTKPENEKMFRSLGFYLLAKTDMAIMLESDFRGISQFLSGLEKPENPGVTGAIVANCNPMTNGHLYLMETAAKECDTLHVFILSEDKSEYSADTRYSIVSEATSHIKNLYLHKSSEYIISSATFPTYFIKASANAQNINADLDLTLFATKIAPYLNITKRFVGTEPFCKVTNAYNERMKLILPKHNIDVVEIERKDQISASRVRQLLKEGNLSEVEKLVPKATFDYLKNQK